MATDEEGGRVGAQSRADGGVVVSGVAADVLDEHVDSFDGEALLLGVA